MFWNKKKSIGIGVGSWDDIWKYDEHSMAIYNVTSLYIILWAAVCSLTNVLYKVSLLYGDGKWLLTYNIFDNV